MWTWLKNALSNGHSIAVYQNMYCGTSGQVLWEIFCKLEGRKPVNIPKSNALSEIGEHWIEKWFHLVFKGLMFLWSKWRQSYITKISLTLLLKKLEIQNELSLIHCQ
jgi:hypothetical protein